MLPCKKCNGNKVWTSKGFIAVDGTVFPDTTYDCNACSKQGFFAPIDEADILKRITAGQGKNKGKIRAAMTSPTSKEGQEAARAYYVWRMARFWSGIDSRMPMTADLVVRGDPFNNELDTLSQKVAKEFYGQDTAGAIRWGRALGMM